MRVIGSSLPVQALPVKGVEPGSSQSEILGLGHASITTSPVSNGEKGESHGQKYPTVPDREPGNDDALAGAGRAATARVARADSAARRLAGNPGIATPAPGARRLAVRRR